MRRAKFSLQGFLALDPKAFGAEFSTQEPQEELFALADGVAVIKIDGPLTTRSVEVPDPWTGGSYVPFDSYEAIEARAAKAFASTARAVALCINSPGGAAAGCFELARALRKLSVDSGKPLGVFVDPCASSAAYAIACSATAGIWAPPTSTVGSLAVYETLADVTAADAQMGLKLLFVPSTGADLKLAGNPHVPPTEAVIKHTQTQVDILTNLFYGLLAEMRGIAPEATRALRGAALLAAQGVENGLVDSVGTYGAFVASLQEGKTMQPKPAAASAAAPNAKAAKGTDEEYAALRTLAESDDPEKKKLAKKMFATMLGEDEKEPDGDEKKEPEGSKEGEEPAARAAAAAPAAQASAAPASDAVALAKRLHAIEVERAAEKEAGRRAELLGKRPDFSAEVRATLMAAPIEVLEKAVTSWPRVNASPLAAAAAAVPGVTPGEKDGVQKHLDADQQRLLDRIGRNTGPRAQQATMVGATLVLDPMSPDAAAARMQQMIADGTAPKAPIDAASVMTKTFKVAGK